MDADERADLRQRVQSQVGCIGYLAGVYPSEVMWLLNALDAAEDRVIDAEAKLRTIPSLIKDA